MSTKPTQARITIDLPNNLQKKLKSLAALNGKSMREIVIQSIEKQIQQLEKATTNVIFKKEI